MYLKAMAACGVGPKECLILEDSPVGKKAAIDSGAYLCPIENPDDVTYEKIKAHLNVHNTTVKEKYAGGSMNVVIPMAGEGTRFPKDTYKIPKPLIEIDGGVTLDNAKEIVQNGCNVLVAGNTVFRSSNPTETIRQLKQC